MTELWRQTHPMPLGWPVRRRKTRGAPSMRPQAPGAARPPVASVSEPDPLSVGLPSRVVQRLVPSRTMCLVAPTPPTALGRVAGRLWASAKRRLVEEHHFAGAAHATLATHGEVKSQLSQPWTTTPLCLAQLARPTVRYTKCQYINNTNNTQQTRRRVPSPAPQS